MWQVYTEGLNQLVLLHHKPCVSFSRRRECSVQWDIFKKRILNKNSEWVKKKVGGNTQRAPSIQIMLPISKM